MRYLASPYTDPDPWVREDRYLRAAKVLTDYLTARIWTYSPIVHCHELAKIVALPADADFWREYDFHMLSKSDMLMVLRIEGWGASKGVNAEIAEANRLGIEIFYI